MENAKDISAAQVSGGKSVPASIAPVETAIPVFIGYTRRRGCENETPPFEIINGILVCKPRKITSVEEYEEYFGKAPAEKATVLTDDFPGVGAAGINEKRVTVNCDISPVHKMYYHIQMYFVNGGGPCYIISVGDTDDAEVKVGNLLAGLKMAEGCSDVTLLLCPQIEHLGAGDAAVFYQAALKQAGESGDRFAILDCCNNDDALSVRGIVGLQNLSFGAVYHPYLRTSLPVLFDKTSVEIRYYVQGKTVRRSIPFEDLSGNLRTAVASELEKITVVLPPSSAIAGIYVSNDRTRKVWSAPADVVLSGVIAPSVEIDGKGQAMHIADNITGKSINVIRAVPGKGSVVIGARTLAGNDRNWKYISMRRLFIMIESGIKRSVALFKSEPNDGKTWVEIQLLIENFLMAFWYQGVLQGADPDRAYFVRIGLGETMTEDDIHEGRMVIDIGLAPVIPSEFMMIRIVQQMDGTTVNGDRWGKDKGKI